MTQALYQIKITISSNSLFIPVPAC